MSSSEGAVTRRSGPPIEVLTRRVAETPADFLALPALDPAETAGVAVDAVVSDLLVLLGGGPLTTATAGSFRPGARDFLADQVTEANRLRVVLIASWLLADPWFVDARPPVDAVLALLDDLVALADHVQPPTLVSDPDRREELARRTLAALGYLPAGETEAQAADRLTTLDSVERARVLAATAEAELRAAAVRQAMHEKAAAEAAAKASRE